MFGIGASELLVIFLFALLFIGPKKLPELAKGLGKGLREFQRAKDDLLDEVNKPAPKDETVDEITVSKESVISVDEQTVQEVTAIVEDQKERAKTDA